MWPVMLTISAEIGFAIEGGTGFSNLSQVRIGLLTSKVDGLLLSVLVHYSHSGNFQSHSNLVLMIREIITL